MFQWDAVDTSPDLGGKNVLDTLQMAIRHNRRTTRTELEREFSVTGFIFTFKNILPALLRGGWAIDLIAPSLWMRH